MTSACIIKQGYIDTILELVLLLMVHLLLFME